MDVSETDPFGQLLRYFRTYDKLSQIELAKRLGVHRNTIVAWEAGTYLPRDPESIDRLEELLFLTPLQTDMLLVAAHFPPKYQVLHTERILPARTPSTPLPVDAVAPPCEPVVLRNPYKGLHAFGQADAGDFFGRERLVADLVEALRSTPSNIGKDQEAELLAILGASGSGKTSTVMAGLLPQLQAGGVPGSEHWLYLEPVVPGNKPLEALALALFPHLPEHSLSMIQQDLADPGARGLFLLTQVLAQQAGTRVVLIVDQFEELFTQSSSKEEVQHFIDLLVMAATEPESPLLALIVLRADFYNQLLSYPALAQLVREYQRLVFPMTRDELRAVIEKPAALPDVRLTFEGTLIDDILAEIHGQAGALPLLQFTLYQLVERSSDRLLTRHAYHEMGGVTGALANYAEAVYAALPSEEHRHFAREVFLRLVSLDVRTRGIDGIARRHAPLHDFVLLQPDETMLLQEVITIFIAARLLVTDSLADVATLEVSHEALLQEWPRLQAWLREATEDLHLQQVLSRDVAEWHRRGKPMDRLYRGSQLTEAKKLVKRMHLSKEEVAFLRASATRTTRFRLVGTALALFLVFLIGLISRPLLEAGLAELRYRIAPTMVTTLSDDGPGSLRRAIVVAKPGSTITFDASLQGTIVLSSSDLDLTKNLIIQGPGAGSVAISGSLYGYSIHVHPGITVSIADLAFKGTYGLAISPSEINPGGGSISNDGILTLTRCSITGDKVFNSTYGDYEAGGGILNRGQLTIIKSTLSNNQASGDGGAVSNGVKGKLTIINSVLSHNRTLNNHGGAIANDGTLMVIDSIISDNLAYQGGGISNNYTASVTVIDSIVSGNSAPFAGGILNDGTFHIIGSTISKNTALVNSRASSVSFVQPEAES